MCRRLVTRNRLRSARGRRNEQTTKLRSGAQDLRSQKMQSALRRGGGGRGGGNQHAGSRNRPAWAGESSVRGGCAGDSRGRQRAAETGGNGEWCWEEDQSRQRTYLRSSSGLPRGAICHRTLGCAKSMGCLLAGGFVAAVDGMVGSVGGREEE